MYPFALYNAPPKGEGDMKIVRIALASLATLTTLLSTAYGQSYGSKCCSDNSTPFPTYCCFIQSVSYVMPADCSGTYQFTQQCICSWTPVWRPSGFCGDAKLSDPGVLEHLWKIAPTGNLLVASCRGTLVLLPRSIDFKLEPKTRPLIQLKDNLSLTSPTPSGE